VKCGAEIEAYYICGDSRVKGQLVTYSEVEVFGIQGMFI
jgi:hypothetical protein